MQGLSLFQSLKQQQKLSPAQIQVVKMLELPSVELQQRINEELQENPALEEGKEETVNEYDSEGMEEESDDREYDNPLQNEDFNYDDYVNDDEMPDYSGAGMSSGQTETAEIPVTAGTSFGEYLKSQVYLTHMTKPERHIAKFVVWTIDDNGYLPRTAEELCDDLAFREGLTVSEEKMREIIREIQTFDPPGVGAHNLQECLLIQLRQKPSTPAIEKAIEIIEKDFDNFSHRRLDRIRQSWQMDDEAMKAVLHEVSLLNPKPGSAWTGTVYERQQTTVIPDFIVTTADGELTIKMNQGDIPDLRVNDSYNRMYADLSNAQTAKQKETLRFVKQKIDSARWFIDAVRQRNETLMRVMRAIVQAQKSFFEQGDPSSLRPMVLQEIATQTGYDVSTISRVSNSKYVQTDFGVYPVKYFFTDRMTTTDGNEISNEEVKKNLRELIENEDKRHPMTDIQVVEEMQKRGYALARRTVAKYRELYGIPVARLRKEI
ncbi:MAG: RNA polymerase factor sigma-54 [Paludibacteraceae bacterium]|nr:RNA polymerase factor sigma-54 [Paludibacteraceae bacterium]